MAALATEGWGPRTPISGTGGMEDEDDATELPRTEGMRWDSVALMSRDNAVFVAVATDWTAQSIGGPFTQNGAFRNRWKHSQANVPSIVILSPCRSIFICWRSCTTPIRGIACSGILMRCCILHFLERWQRRWAAELLHRWAEINITQLSFRII